MDFLQLVLSRQSDRAYDKERPVEAEKLERILEAARLAPSACNAQPWKFVVVTDHELASKVGKAAAGLGMNKFAKDAPVHILVVEESANITSLLGGKVKGKHFPLIDIGIAAAHITLAAENEGLGSCILGWFDEKEIKQLTGIPASKRLPQIIVVGSINTDISLNIPHLPNPNETIVTSRHSISPGGKGTNQAVGVAKLNHKVTLLGNVGNDLDVGLIYSCLEEHGIDSSGIHRDRSVNTGKAYIQIQDDGESIITLLTGANATLTAQTLRNNSHFFENCAYCLLQTEIAIEAVEEAVLIAKENNVKTILKPAAVSSLSESILKHTDILIPNQAEMALLCNRPASIDTAELSHQADIMLQKGVGAVVITLGEFGCFLKTAG